MFIVYMCSFVCVVFIFFFQQKTAYEMRISDWSSDVCSSDLRRQLDERELDRLILRQRLAEGLALARIFHAFLDAINRRAQRRGRLPDAVLVDERKRVV